MCDPLTIAGVAMTAGSTVANSMAQSRAAGARKDALAAERIRQGGYDQEAQALNTQSQDRYKDFEGQEEAKAAKLADYYKSQSVPEPEAGVALPTSASNIVLREEGKQRGKAREFTDRTGEALGALRAFGDVLADRSRLQARDAALIGQVGGFKKGSSAVMPYELDAANKRGAGLKLFGDILGGLGGVATVAGLGGGNLFGLGSSGPMNIVPAAAKVTPTAVGASVPYTPRMPGLGALY